jgi:hypothetical protein
MAVKAMQATDPQLQIPLALTSLGLFVSVFTGSAMSTRRKKPFVLLPGLLGAASMLLMAWTHSALWFLLVAGVISVFDFAIRPAMPSILRTVYPANCRSHIAGTLRQYSSIVFLLSTLLFASLLNLSGDHIRVMIRLQLTLAGLIGIAAFACFRQLPDHGDGSAEEANLGPGKEPLWRLGWSSLTPLRDPAFRRYVLIFFFFSSGNLFYSGIVPAFFARDLRLDYVQATLFIHVLPGVTGFLGGGRLTAWFDRIPIWKAYGLVALLWGLDPLLLSMTALTSAWPLLTWTLIAVARTVRGPAAVGSMVLAFYTGVHAFARPGRDTSCYVSTQFLANGVARLAAPLATAFSSGYLSHPAILFIGASVVLTGSWLFQVSAKVFHQSPRLD